MNDKSILGFFFKISAGDDEIWSGKKDTGTYLKTQPTRVAKSSG
jgi:hypothetical protein